MPSSPSPPDRSSAGLADGHEPDRVAGPELPDLPQLPAGDNRRAGEPAEAGPVGAEDDRRVSGEVERTDRVGNVVNVGRVQPRLAAVLARPPRPRPDEPDPGPRRVVV